MRKGTITLMAITVLFSAVDLMADAAEDADAFLLSKDLTRFGDYYVIKDAHFALRKSFAAATAAKRKSVAALPPIIRRKVDQIELQIRSNRSEIDLIGQAARDRGGYFADEATAMKELRKKNAQMQESVKVLKKPQAAKYKVYVSELKKAIADSDTLLLKYIQLRKDEKITEALKTLTAARKRSVKLGPHPTILTINKSLAEWGEILLKETLPIRLVGGLAYVKIGLGPTINAGSSEGVVVEMLYDTGASSMAIPLTSASIARVAARRSGLMAAS